jgi:predicted TPR repeat methyltransferase
LHRAGRLDEAEAIYRSLLKREPLHPDALHFLGVLEHQRGHVSEAIQLIRRATEVAPGYTDAINNLGNVLKASGDLDQAEGCYRRTLALEPRHAKACSNLGAVLRATGDLDAAEEACRKAITIEPALVEAHINLGTVLVRKGLAEEGLSCYRAGIELDPKHLDAPKLLGLTLNSLGRIVEAKQLYAQWLERDPGNPVATHMLAACSGERVPGRASDGYVKGIFDGMASDFDRHLMQLGYCAPEVVRVAVERQLPECLASLNVLDAGCGTGLCARFLRAYAQRLTGVDLSVGMLRRASQTELYDELIEAEVTAFLQNHLTSYDLIVSADTLCYFGELETVLTAAAYALRPNGLFVFTVERLTNNDDVTNYCLAPHGRYSHTEKYVRSALRDAHFLEMKIEEVVLRSEAGSPVVGLVVTGKKA